MQDKEKEAKHRKYIEEVVSTTQPNAGTSLNGHVLVGMQLVLDGQRELLDRIAKIDRLDMFADVVAFHEKFGIDYQGPVRADLPEKLQKFREATHSEELLEYQMATTPEERLDALVDAIYFLLGTAHLHGFDKFNEAWRRVHAANMRKELCSDKNPSKRGGEGVDIVKPPGWVPPDLSDLVSEVSK